MRALFLAILPCLLLACSNKNEDLKHFIAEVKQRRTQTSSTLPHFEVQKIEVPLAVFPHNPFQNEAVIVHKQRKKHALEAFPLEALRFVGTIKIGKTLWALIRRPDEQIVRLGLGERLGQKGGRIVSIEGRRIQLEEILHSPKKQLKHLVLLSLDDPLYRTLS